MRLECDTTALVSSKNLAGPAGDCAHVCFISSDLSSLRHARQLRSLGNLRQVHTNFCPTLIGTDQFDVATMRSSQLPRDAQAQPMSGHAFAAAHPVKALE